MRKILFILSFLIAGNSLLHAQQLVITDDSTWQSSNAFVPGWNVPGFNPVGWVNSVAPAPGYQFFWLVTINTPSMWAGGTFNDSAYFIKNFHLNCLPSAATIDFHADDSMWVWLNGNFVGTAWSWNQFSGNALPFLQTGNNTIAIMAVNDSAFGTNCQVDFKMVIDTVFVPNPFPDFWPNDTTLCDGASLQIQANGGSNYLWSDSSTFSSATISQSGTFWLQIDSAACSYSDTFQLSYFPSPNQFLGNDTSLCAGDSLQLNLPQNQSLLWFDSDSTSATRSFSASALIYAEIIDSNNCLYRDTVNFIVDTIPIISVADSSFYCLPNLFTSNFNTHLRHVIWSTGDTAFNYSIDNSGNYNVEVIDTNNCSNSKNFYVEIDSLPKIDIRDTFHVCTGDSLFLEILNSGGTSFLWNTGSTDSSITAFADSIYTVDVSNACGTSSKQIVLSSGLAKTLKLRDDTTLCNFDSLLLHADDSPFDSIIWNNAFKVSSIWAIAGNVYTAIGYSRCGNDTDSVAVLLNSTPMINLGADTIICNDDTLVLSVAGNQADSIVWNGQFMQDSLIIDSAGLYYVSVYNACGMASDSILIGTKTIPEVNLLDTNLCLGDTINLSAFWPNSQYNWNTGDTSSVVRARANASYRVTVSNECGFSTDNTFIGLIPNPSLNFPPEAIACNNQLVNVDATIFDGQSYLWSNGSTSPQQSFFAEGTYSVTATSSCGSIVSSFFLNRKETPQLNLQPDEIMCDGEELAITATFPKTTVFWNTGETSNTIIVEETGTYRATLTNECGSATSEKFVEFINPPTVELGNDTTICSNIPLVLSATEADYAQFLWSNGSRDSGLAVTRAGVYTLFAENMCGAASDAIRVKVLENPQINLGNDTSICGNSAFELKTTFNSNWKYQWNTDDQTNSILVSESGLYSVLITNECNLDFGAEVYVEFIRSPDPFVPNTFSPNDDLMNDAFKPVFSFPIEYKFKIYNRWGIEIYNSKNDDSGWKGTLAGEKLQSGVYSYQLEYPRCYGNIEKKLGKVFLLD